jgi:hypothetical protein
VVLDEMTLWGRAIFPLLELAETGNVRAWGRGRARGEGSLLGHGDEVSEHGATQGVRLVDRGDRVCWERAGP